MTRFTKAIVRTPGASVVHGLRAMGFQPGDAVAGVAARGEEHGRQVRVLQRRVEARALGGSLDQQGCHQNDNEHGWQIDIAPHLDRVKQVWRGRFAKSERGFGHQRIGITDHTGEMYA